MSSQTNVTTKTENRDWSDKLIAFVTLDRVLITLIGLMGIIYQADWLYMLAILLGICVIELKVVALLQMASKKEKSQLQRETEMRQRLVREVRTQVVADLTAIIEKHAKGTDKRIESLHQYLVQAEDNGDEV